MKKLLAANILLALTATTFTASAQSIRPGAFISYAPVITDSTGKIVGRATGGGENGSVIISYNNEPLLLRLHPHGTMDGRALFSTGLMWHEGTLYYRTSNCTGPAHMEPVHGSRRVVAAIKEGNQWIAYVSPQNVIPGPLISLSIRYPQGNCVASINDNRQLVPVEKTFSLDSFGIPPFYIQ